MDVATVPVLADFLAQTDLVGKVVLGIMLLMSVITWYLIIVKVMEVSVQRWRARGFLRLFQSGAPLAAIEQYLKGKRRKEPFSRLAHHAISSAQHYGHHNGGAGASESPADVLTRSMRRVIDEESAQLEWGLTLLASIGSTAPFVGLFGTVWGVYHALIVIGAGGQGTLDKVAGPVGEALIMTAIGLAVAVPAVLAYNAFVRRNRLLLARLGAFAHDLYAFLITGNHYIERDERPAPKLVRGEA